ncbi:ABC transporter permease [Promicromonospora sp. NPDC023987]|uniref:ABC transporter permease n=1 Tax=Promicromonospora sp. NPDC023987 TaxID=3155360 RepID=UPI0033C91143
MTRLPMYRRGRLQGFAGAFSSELIKLRQSTYWICAAAMAAFMAITMVIAVPGPEVTSDRGPAGLVLSSEALTASDGLGRSLGNSITFIGIVTLTVVAINVGSEYNHGVIRNLLVRQPHRTRLFFGKITALMGYLTVAVVLASTCGAVLAELLAGSDVETGAWWTRAGLAASAGGMGNVVVATWGWAAFGIALAMLLRSAPATIGVGVAYALPVEILLVELSDDLSRWLPGQLFQSLARGGSESVDHTGALVGSLGWTAAATVLALLVFRYRDVPD